MVIKSMSKAKTKRTAREARMAKLASWASHITGKTIRLENLPAGDVDRLLELYAKVATFREGERQAVGVDWSRVEDEAYGFGMRALERAARRPDAEHGRRGHDRESVATTMGRLLAEWLASDEQSPDLEELRAWARSAELVEQVMGSKLLADDVADGALDLLDGGCLWEILRRVATSPTGVAELMDREGARAPHQAPNPAVLRIPWGGVSLREEIDALSVSGWIESSPPQVRGQSKIWQVRVGPRALAAGDAARRWRELALATRRREAGAKLPKTSAAAQPTAAGGEG